MKKPELRFPEFTDAWEQRKLGEIADVTKLAGFEFTEHVVYSDDGNIIALRGLNIKNGQLILDDVKYIDGSNFSKLSRCKLFIDDIMFTYVGTVGEVAIIKENDRFYLAPNVSRIRVKSDDSPKFISHYMRTDNFKNKVIFPLIATSSQPALSMENIRKFTINIPTNREEQDRLAKYFDNVDHLIALQQRKYEQLLNVKKSMLEKMFPKEGEKVPEIRFEGFTDDWEQRKLGDISESYSGGTPTADKKEYYNGDIPFIRSGEISGDKTELFITDEGLNNSSAKMVQIGYILYALYGATSGEVSISKLKGAINQAVLAIQPHQNYDSQFLMQWLRKSKDNIIGTYLQGGQGNLSGNIVKELIVDVPTYEEQKGIGAYFQQLDNLITLHQRKYEKLLDVKKALLSKLIGGAN